MGRRRLLGADLGDRLAGGLRRAGGRGRHCGFSMNLVIAVVAFAILILVVALLARGARGAIRTEALAFAIAAATAAATAAAAAAATAFAITQRLAIGAERARDGGGTGQVGDRSGVEHFRLGGGGEIATQSDLLGLGGDRGRGGGDRLGSGLFRGGRHGDRALGGGLASTAGGSGGGQAAAETGQHALQREDEVLLAELAAVLDVVFAGELAQVLDGQGGEIGVVRHVRQILSLTAPMA